MAKQKASAHTVERVINVNVLIGLLKEKATNKSKIAEINGEFGSRLKHHVELSGLLKFPFQVIHKLDSMNEADRTAALREINRMSEDLIAKGHWPAHVGDLAEQAQAAADAANGNQPDEPVPASDEQPDDDPRPESLKRRHEEIEAEQKAATEAVVADNVTKLRRGIKKAKPADAVVH